MSTPDPNWPVINPNARRQAQGTAPQIGAPQNSAPGPVPTAQPVPLQPAPFAQPTQPATAQPASLPPQATQSPQPILPQPIQPAGNLLDSIPRQPVSPQYAQTPSAVSPQPVAAQSQTSRAARPLPAQPVDDPNAMRVHEPSADDELAEHTPEVLKNAPPWLVSTIVHAVGLVILGLLVIVNQRRPQVELYVDPVYAEELGEQLEDDTFDMALEKTEILEPVLSEDINPVDDPLAAPPDIPDVVLDAVTQSSEIAAPSIGMALNGREKGMKKALLGAYGGTATTEAAVLRGLEWLKRNQRADGSWSLSGPYANGGMTENRSAATAMALLAFQGAGHTHQSGKFKTTVAKGWAWLLNQQDPDGNFFHEGAHHHRLYTQAQCSIAICELYGMTKDPKYKEPAQKSLDYALQAQNPLGGWRYVPKQDADTSVTGWFVMALQSGMMAGLQVPSPSLDTIHRFLDSVTPDNGVHYAYKPGQVTTPTMTAEALLCRQYLGWSRDDPRLLQGCDYIANHPIDFGEHDVYYWYYATQVNHHMDGDYWKRWNEVMREVIPKAQVKTGNESGSWNPADDRWGAHGGRLYTTCLSIYMLEVYYRHLPIYKYRLQ